MAKKFDGVVEAVHYSPEGLLTVARIYERRGSAFSDCVLVKRDDLIQRIKSGKHYVIGQRREFMAGTFETGAALTLIEKDGHEYLSTGPEPAGRDRVETPQF